jgi:hypothetical protein
MDAPAPTFVLRLLSPHHAAVVDSVEAQLVASEPDEPIVVERKGDLVVFRGASSDASLRSRVGRALVGVLGPVGWYDYFRPAGPPHR